MSFFSSIPRKAYPVEVQGVKYHVRSLTRNEIKSFDLTAEPDEQNFALLKYCLCNENGEPILSDDDKASLNDAPLDVIVQLVEACSNLIAAKKKLEPHRLKVWQLSELWGKFPWEIDRGDIPQNYWVEADAYLPQSMQAIAAALICKFIARYNNDSISIADILHLDVDDITPEQNARNMAGMVTVIKKKKTK